MPGARSIVGRIHPEFLKMLLLGSLLLIAFSQYAAGQSASSSDDRRIREDGNLEQGALASDSNVISNNGAKNALVIGIAAIII